MTIVAGRLYVAPCERQAAEYACRNWHYSGKMPAGKLVMLGVWEGAPPERSFRGAVVFGRGANNHIGNPYGLDQTEVCELVRVALRSHLAPVSQVLAVALRTVRRTSPGLRLVVSYADPEQRHHGGIYQASGWIYVGQTTPQSEVIYQGRRMHRRSVNSVRGTVKGLPATAPSWKHKYLFPFDRRLRRRLEGQAQPHPRRSAGDGG